MPIKKKTVKKKINRKQIKKTVAAAADKVVKKGEVEVSEDEAHTASVKRHVGKYAMKRVRAFLKGFENPKFKELHPRLKQLGLTKHNLYKVDIEEDINGLMVVGVWADENGKIVKSHFFVHFMEILEGTATVDFIMDALAANLMTRLFFNHENRDKKAK